MAPRGAIGGLGWDTFCKGVARRECAIVTAWSVCRCMAGLGRAIRLSVFVLNYPEAQLFLRLNPRTDVAVAQRRTLVCVATGGPLRDINVR